MTWYRNRKLKLSVWAWIGLTCVFSFVVVIGLFGTKLDRWAGRRLARWLDDGKVHVTISEPTTRILEPLRGDGYVDYAAALDRLASAGVTPDDNSSVLLWQAVGPQEIGPSMRAEYFQRLGMKEPPIEGEYLPTFEAYVKKNYPELRKKDTAATDWWEHAIFKRPWTKQEFPLAAEWLAANERNLSLVIEASHRPRRYDPLISHDGLACWVFLPYLNQYSHAMRALIARAMLRIRKAEFDGAWADVMAAHRLARLVGQGQFVVEAAVACGREETACRAEQALLQTPPTVAQVTEIERGLDSLDPMPKLAGKIDVSDRYMFLDVASAAARDGFSVIRQFPIWYDGGSQKGISDALKDSILQPRVDWDAVLRKINALFDRVVIASRQPLRRERAQALGVIDAEIERIKAEGKAALAAGNPRGSKAGVAEHVYQMLMATLAETFSTGTFVSYCNFEDRAAMRRDLTRVACGLAKYRADHGEYPQTLDDLMPQYLAKVPEDIFAEAPLKYARQPAGYQLYSVGPNGKNDQGKSDDDDWKNGGPDDLTAGMPAHARQHRCEAVIRFSERRANSAARFLASVLPHRLLAFPSDSTL